jgi:hypothetical protein
MLSTVKFNSAKLLPPINKKHIKAIDKLRFNLLTLKGSLKIISSIKGAIIRIKNIASLELFLK